MPQSRAPRPVPPHLEPLLLAVAAAARQHRTAERSVTPTLGLTQAPGRHALTQVLLGLGHGDRDWSAAYRLFLHRRVAWEAARRELAAWAPRHVPRTRPLVVVLDATQLPRTSPRLVGCGWLKAPGTPCWKPGIHRAQRWVGLSALLPRSRRGESRAVPPWFFPAPAPKATPWPDHPPCREWEAAPRALTWLRATLDGLGRSRQRILAVADGRYGVAPLWRALPPPLSLLARCARNRALFALPAPPAPGARGRRRKYGARGPAPRRPPASPRLADHPGGVAGPLRPVAGARHRPLAGQTRPRAAVVLAGGARHQAAPGRPHHPARADVPAGLGRI